MQMRAAFKFVVRPLSALSFVVAVAGVLVFACAAALGAGDADVGNCENGAFEGFREYMPDCRAYEMVSPVYKEGYVASVQGASPDGSRVLADALGVFAGAQGDEYASGAWYVFSRSGDGWGASSITPAVSAFPAQLFAAASSGLERSLWLLRTPSQSVYAEDVYVREADGSFVRVGPLVPPALEAGSPAGISQIFGYQASIKYIDASSDLSHSLFEFLSRGPLWPGDMTETQGKNNLSLYEFAGSAARPELVGVSDGRTVVDGKVLPVGELISDCETAAGSTASDDVYNAISADGARVFFTAVGHSSGSCGGGVEAPAVSELYGRLDQAETAPISEPTEAACEACLSGRTSEKRVKEITGGAESSVTEEPGEFAGASEDGSKVFFTGEQELLYGAKGMNLWEYDFDGPAGAKVTRVSTVEGAAPAEVRGVARVSEDGSHVYFVAGGVLETTGTATTVAGSNVLEHVTTASGTGELAAGSETIENVLTSTGTFTVGQTISATGIPAGALITEVGPHSLTLSEAATETGAQALSAGAQPFKAGETVAGAGIPKGTRITAVNGQSLELSAAASASASGVAVTVANSEGNAPVAKADNLYVYEDDATHPLGQVTFIATLAPGDSEDWSTTDQRPAQATPDGEFLAFRSAADLTAGDTSSKPQIFEYDAGTGELARVSVGQAGYPEGIAAAEANPAAITPSFYDSAGSNPAQAATLVVSEDGSTVLFTSVGALVEEAKPASAAGVASVYEYHSTGRIGNGNVYLISDGASTLPNSLVGLDASGTDAFFETPTPLAKSGTDGQNDVYDARAGGGFPRPRPHIRMRRRRLSSGGGFCAGVWCAGEYGRSERGFSPALSCRFAVRASGAACAFVAGAEACGGVAGVSA